MSVVKNKLLLSNCLALAAFNQALKLDQSAGNSQTDEVVIFTDKLNQN